MDRIKYYRSPVRDGNEILRSNRVTKILKICLKLNLDM